MPSSLVPGQWPASSLRRHIAVLALGVSATVGAWAQADPASTLPAGGLRWASGAWQSTLGLEANVYAYQMKGTWWGLPALGNPGFNPERSYAELWLHPRLHAEYDLGGGNKAYGSVSLGLTQDIGENAFAVRNEGDAQLENAYVGWKGRVGPGSLDLSVGRQPFTLGSGMLLYAGSSNGGEWGNAASAKRIAWERAAIARYSQSGWTAQAFWLDPNELPSTESETRVTGLSVEWQPQPTQRAGLAWLHVPKSNFFYPGELAPFAFIEQGRKDLNVTHGWFDWQGIPGLPAGLSVRGEFALQRGEVTRLNGRVDDHEAHAAYLGTSYWFQQWPFAPKLSYGYGYFSGDDPKTTDRYERFDPMFWGNGLDNWWFGANGSYAFINSNVRFQRFTMDGYLSAQDIFKLQYVRTYAAELNSPIQFGQGVRFSGVSPVVGVASAHLASEWMFQYVHVFKPTLVASAYVSRSTPGEGLRQITGAQSKAWNTLGMGVFYQY